ncbi:MAG: hypothetical protein M1837_003837 [Sclerophora amabilis]|nr:MAG: hypothetical protein M1837_003837 [Sclerophora amabilis]
MSSVQIESTQQNDKSQHSLPFCIDKDDYSASVPTVHEVGEAAQSPEKDIGRRSRSRKRIRAQYSDRRSTKRVRTRHNEAYRRLLNSEIESTFSRASGVEQALFPSSYVGFSLWTTEEKQAFFYFLTILGRDNIKEIASKIGTKTQLEVRFYVLCLKQGLCEYNLNARRVDIPSAIDLPIATEISAECCDALDQAANLLGHHQQRYEEAFEQTRWPDLWLLTGDTAEWLDGKLDRDGMDQEGAETYAPEFGLLNLGTWLELSEQIFMNPSAPKEDENWRNIAQEDEEPSILRTAFAEFYSLAISITKRLVQASLFCATSRLRAITSQHQTQLPIVTINDVHAACRTLKIKFDSIEFWIGAARRCGLEIYNDEAAVGRKGKRPVYMSYDEVEQSLGENSIVLGNTSGDDTVNHQVVASEISDAEHGSDEELSQSRRQPISDGSDPSDVADLKHPEASSEHIKSESETETETERDLDSDSPLFYAQEVDRPIDPSDAEFKNLHTRRARILNQYHAHLELENARNAYMEAIDRRESLEEERRLWAVLKQDPPSEIDPTTIKLPHNPIKERLRPEDLTDWRERLDYSSDWETLRAQVPEHGFLERLEGRNYARLGRSDHAPAVPGSQSGYMIRGRQSSNGSHDENDHGDVKDGSSGSDTVCSPAVRYHKSSPRPQRTRSLPKVMPGMIPTGTAVEGVDGAGPSTHGSSTAQAWHYDDDEDEDKTYESPK